MSDMQSTNWPEHGVVVWPTTLRRNMVLAALAMLAATSIMLFARRTAGALTSPLDPAALLVIGAAAAAVAAAIRVGWLRAPTDRTGPWPDRIVMALTSLAVLLLGTVLCVPGTVVWAKILLFVLLAVEEGWAWERYLRRTVPVSKPHMAGAEYREEPHTECAECGEEVVQQLTRSRAADGTESLTGWLRMPLAAGQRTGSLHVAFCPPLATTPELEVEQIDGPEARVKTAQLLPYGARLDLKLAAAAEEPTSVLLQFAARTLDCGDSSPLSAERG